jgi:outer membrane protein assembly factor BamB
MPVDFGPGKNVVWTTPLPPGKSSPILAGNRIYITATEDGELLTMALDSGTGRILWRRGIPQPRREALHKLNNPASSTPVTDGENVWAFFGDFGLVAYGPDGTERWRLPLGPFNNLHGMAASPVLVGDKLILVCDQDTDSFLIAVNNRTGRILWKTPREAVVHGFSTPTIWQPAGGEAQVIVPGSYLLTSYSAKDGAEVWRTRGLSWQIKTTAVIDDGRLFVTGWAPGADPGQAKPIPEFAEAAKAADANGDGKLANDELPQPWKHTGSWQAIDLDHDGFLNSREWGFYQARRSASNATMAVRLDEAARGDITDTHVLWRHQRFVPQVSSPLVTSGLVFTIKDGGILTAMDAATGQIRKSARIPGAVDPYYASPVASDGKLYLVSENGKVSVTSVSADWEVLAVNDLGEPAYATPALLPGRILLRTGSALYCFGKN